MALSDAEEEICRQVYEVSGIASFEVYDVFFFTSSPFPRVLFDGVGYSVGTYPGSVISTEDEKAEKPLNCIGIVYTLPY